MGFISEFRQFAVRGNMVDMAVGIVIGAGFGMVVKSFVDDLIMPLTGLFGKADFSNWYVGLNDVVRKANADANFHLSLEEARKVGPVFAYGNFITQVINFTILAFAVFLMVKLINTARKRFEAEQKAQAAAPPAAPEDVVVLREIRDLLKTRND